MKKKEFITEAKKKTILAERENAILESFAETFKKIKRVDEDFDYADAERQYHDKLNNQEEFVVAMPYSEMARLFNASKKVDSVSYVGPNHKEVFYKHQAQKFTREEAEQIKNSLTNKNSYIEPA